MGSAGGGVKFNELLCRHSPPTEVFYHLAYDYERSFLSFNIMEITNFDAKLKKGAITAPFLIILPLPSPQVVRLCFVRVGLIV